MGLLCKAPGGWVMGQGERKKSPLYGLKSFVPTDIPNSYLILYICHTSVEACPLADTPLVGA